MEHALAEVAVRQGSPGAALEQPTGPALTDENPKHFGERLIDVDLADRVLRFRGEVPSLPNAPADLYHAALDVHILDIQPGVFTDPHPRSREQGKQHLILAWCCLDDSLQLLLRKVPLLRP